MAQVKRIDFAKAKAENKILRGLVKECEVIESTDGQKKSQYYQLYRCICLGYASCGKGILGRET